MTESKRYGVPYMGSKSRIAKALVRQLPKAKHLYDIFAGGCAVTHRALMEGRWEHYHANDVSPFPLELFKMGMEGRIDVTRWVSREEFFRLRDTDPVVRLCWSFGNNQRQYLYGEDVEPFKKALHYAICFCDFEPIRELLGWDLSPIAKYDTVYERRMAYRQKVLPNIPGVKKLSGSHYCIDTDYSAESIPHLERIDAIQNLDAVELLHYVERITDLRKIENVESLQNIERLQNIESLQNIERLQNIEFTNKDYRELEFEDDVVVYCDPPYKGTAGYEGKSHYNDFDHEAFYEWASNQKVPIFISEYSMPEDRFTKVWECPINCTLSATKVNKKAECMFVPRHQKERILEPSLFVF